MKEEALKLANLLDTNLDIDATIDWSYKAQAIIRNLVNELEKTSEEDFKSVTRKELLDYIEYLRKCLDTKPLDEDAIANIWVNYGVPVIGTVFIDVVREIEKRHGIK